ncbi:unnamed protein product [Caenorhabditis angaria]|uniref:Uncharacterized protein n=1 Tax=Caenorhabditis angaria TaxID=860376 RepID=A0A9P1IG47_9PELO|nr:unnamed protein product [Caenorhabditis angaria]
MEVESPASPPPTLEEEKPKIDKENAVKNIPLVDDEEDEYVDDVGSELQERSKNESSIALSITEKYKHASNLYESFQDLVNCGDLNAIYRNRQVFINQKRSNLVRPALDVFRELPSSRPAVFYYVGLILHEYTHHSFNKIENPSHPVNPIQIRETITKFLDVFQKFVDETENRKGLADMLTFICNFCAELSGNNGGRPSMSQNKTPEAMLSFFLKWDQISKLIALMDNIIANLLEKSPEMCMKVLFDASRHGPHFNWIWLHIAINYPGSTITHLLKTGVEQIQKFIDEFKNPAIHQEYQQKFLAISDIFNFLMRKKSPELQETVRNMIIESLNSSNKNLSFLFFLKLVTNNMETLRNVVTSNSDLITTWNAIRATRQIATISDKATIILPNLSIGYGEFTKQVVSIMEPKTHAVFLEMMIALVYDKKVFDGENNPSTINSQKSLVQNCAPVLESMVDKLVQLAHSSTGNSTICPSQHPSIISFSFDEKLQFLIESFANHVDKSHSIIRHLHAIAIANGISKASEIVLRFLLTISHETPQFIYIMTAYITVTHKFFPKMMENVYSEFFAQKTIIEMSLPDDIDRSKLHLNLLNNLRILFEWDASLEESNPNSFLGFYPGNKIGSVLNIIMDDSLKFLNEETNLEKRLTMIRMTTKLLDAVCAVNSKKQSRKLLISISNWYKLMAQLALLLKCALLTVGRKNDAGITVFEELRTAILTFLYNGSLDAQLMKFVPIFTNFFIQACFSDAQILFGEKIVDDNLLDEQGINKSFDLVNLEAGPNVIQGLSKLKMHDNALDMMHSGQLKKRRRIGGDFEINDIKNMTEEEEERFEDEYQRIYVVLDAFRAMCTTGAQDIRLHNSKQIATILVDSICRDILSSEMKFDDWDIESEYIHRHVEIDRRISRSVFADGLMRMLSETRSFAFCLPILKSQLAVIISDAEKSSDRTRIGERTRDKLHRWILLASKAAIIPARFVYLCDLEQFTNSHETFLMLLEIWRFLQGRNLTISIIENYHKELLKGDVDEGLPNEKEGNDRATFDSVRLILQNHLVESYHLFPKLFATEYSALKINTIE